MTAETTKTTPRLTRDQIRELADELIRALTPYAGNPDAVRRVMDRWVTVLHPDDLGYVALRAVWRTFAHCLTPTPPDQAPPGALALIPPTEGDAA